MTDTPMSLQRARELMVKVCRPEDRAEAIRVLAAHEAKEKAAATPAPAAPAPAAPVGRFQHGGKKPRSDGNPFQ